jgi:GTP-binding protein
MSKTTARFVTSCFESHQFPKAMSLVGTPLLECAIVGRSNVGKSSLINFIFESKDLAKTSATPGKTSTLNFFCYNEMFFFVDFPGYGFALLSDAHKMAFRKLSEAYFSKREGCKAVLFLFDIRREPKEEDIQLFNYLSQQRKVIGVITKADKVAPTKRLTEQKRIEKAFGTPFVLTSTTDKIGKKEILKSLMETLT